MKKKQHQPDDKVDVVFIRKSSDQQDERPQAGNVAGMLRVKGVHVPERFWFTGVVSRRKVKGDEPFNADYRGGPNCQKGHPSAGVRAGR